MIPREEVSRRGLAPSGSVVPGHARPPMAEIQRTRDGLRALFPPSAARVAPARSIPVPLLIPLLQALGLQDISVGAIVIALQTEGFVVERRADAPCEAAVSINPSVMDDASLAARRMHERRFG